ncbi:MAG: hypothetical protein K2G82_05905 [Paramuribaculum sp.]|nr:hypothetical protein [Paramuribaculum sp.]
MNRVVNEFVAMIRDNASIATKNEMISLVCDVFDMVKDGRSLYHTDYFAVVFCYTKNASFSNVVISLSKLEKYDGIPCFVVVVRRDLDNMVYMINSTFIDKVSHSSQSLRLDNIRGSILGSNIRKQLPEIGRVNAPDDFEELFAYHKGFTWMENLERIVERTNNIRPVKVKVALSPVEYSNVLDAPRRASLFVSSGDYDVLLDDLRRRCEDVKDAILVASHIDNVNVRGRLIEVLITSDPEERTMLLKDLSDVERMLPVYDTENGLGDYVRRFGNADAYTDIKTKILYLDSNPKAYNVDKFLKCMGEERSVFMFFFVGIDDSGIVNTVLCSVFHDQLMKTTILQHHWAGRATRGVAQFNGKAINEILSERDFRNNIDEESSRSYLEDLLKR